MLKGVSSFYEIHDLALVMKTDHFLIDDYEKCLTFGNLIFMCGELSNTYILLRGQGIKTIKCLSASGQRAFCKKLLVHVSVKPK